jgi:sugar (pentulose or hexulose) kinase
MIMKILAIDVGSSSIKAALCKNGRIKHIHHVDISTVLNGAEVEIPAAGLLKSFRKAIRLITQSHKHIDAIALDSFCPGVVALDKTGTPLFGCVTHQDRRSRKQAAAIEKQIGQSRHLSLVGNRPFPGGIGSTTLLWIKENKPDLYKKISRIGQPTSLLVDHLTGQWVIDPSQAAFLGLYDSINLSGWVDELCHLIGVRASQLPRILFADQIAGKVTRSAADQLGLPEGCPVLTSLVDTSAAMLATDCRAGTLVHSAGSTDVLALCLDKPAPAEDILTRPLGTGASLPKRWLAVSTIAAGGSTMHWLKDNLFADYSKNKFHKLVERIGKDLRLQSSPVRLESAPAVVFAPYLAGDRTAMEESTGAFDHLTLASTREEMLHAAILALAQASRQRFTRLAKIRSIHKEIYTMGGQTELAGIMHAHWPGKWKFTVLQDEAMTGLNRLGAIAGSDKKT